MNREFDGFIEAMNFFEINHSAIITLELSANFEKDGKTITLIPFHQWGIQTDLFI